MVIANVHAVFNVESFDVCGETPDEFRYQEFQN